MSTAAVDPFDDHGQGEDEDDYLAQRRAQVMLLKHSGGTYTEIARVLGISTTTVRRDYFIALREQRMLSAEDRAARQVAILGDICKANYSAMLTGDKDAAITIIKALEREAKLFGLDAPTRLIAGVSSEQFATEAHDLINKIIKLDPTALHEIEGPRHAARPDTDHHRIVDAEVEDDLAAGHAPAIPEGAVDPYWRDPWAVDPAEPYGFDGTEADPQLWQRAQRDQRPAAPVEEDEADDLDGWSNIG
ncbi:hypothetical protein PBI_THONKO_73 [Mycobacterium phage Thonko]|uniref:DNA binding protein n=1 Tax=Mycobacterium phage Thonko TaxID=2282910 RepID=A0A346FCB9_9CAUD|nr:Rnase E [Mycobacterium phage Thonko]AXN53344.1 hypothetical protein PBI_THONKO_73 [Mycobacterium phage Thonko]